LNTYDSSILIAYSLCWNLIFINFILLCFLFSEGIQKLKEKAKVKKGRGFVDSGKPDRDVGGFEAMETEGEGDEPGPQRCKLVPRT